MFLKWKTTSNIFGNRRRLHIFLKIEDNLKYFENEIQPQRKWNTTSNISEIGRQPQILNKMKENPKYFSKLMTTLFVFKMEDDLFC